MHTEILFEKTMQEQIRDKILEILYKKDGFQAYKDSDINQKNLSTCAYIASRFIEKMEPVSKEDEELEPMSKEDEELEPMTETIATMFDKFLSINANGILSTISYLFKNWSNNKQSIFPDAQRIADNADKIIKIIEHYYEDEGNNAVWCEVKGDDISWCWPFKFEMLLKAVVEHPEAAETAFADPEFYKLYQYFYDIAVRSEYSSLINDHGFSNEQLIDLYKSEDFQTFYLMQGLRFYEEAASEANTTVLELVKLAASNKDFYDSYKSIYNYLQNVEEGRAGYGAQDYEDAIAQLSPPKNDDEIVQLSLPEESPDEIEPEQISEVVTHEDGTTEIEQTHLFDDCLHGDLVLG